MVTVVAEGGQYRVHSFGLLEQSVVFVGRGFDLLADCAVLIVMRVRAIASAHTHVVCHVAFLLGVQFPDVPAPIDQETCNFGQFARGIAVVHLGLPGHCNVSVENLGVKSLPRQSVPDHFGLNALFAVLEQAEKDLACVGFKADREILVLQVQLGVDATEGCIDIGVREQVLGEFVPADPIYREHGPKRRLQGSPAVWPIFTNRFPGYSRQVPLVIKQGNIVDRVGINNGILWSFRGQIRALSRNGLGGVGRFGEGRAGVVELRRRRRGGPRAAAG